MKCSKHNHNSNLVRCKQCMAEEMRNFYASPKRRYTTPDKEDLK